MCATAAPARAASSAASAIAAGVTGTCSLRAAVSPAPVTAQVMKTSVFIDRRTIHRAPARARSRTRGTARPAVGDSRSSRYCGPETQSAAMHEPSCQTGAASPTSPGSNSPSETAKPRSRTSSSSRPSAAGSTIVRSVQRLSRPRPVVTAANASSTLPSAVQWIGVRRPTHFPDDTKYAPPACATVSASSPATTASVTVSPVSEASRSINGWARVASSRLASVTRPSRATSGPSCTRSPTCVRSRNPRARSVDTSRDAVLRWIPSRSAISVTLSASAGVRNCWSTCSARSAVCSVMSPYAFAARSDIIMHARALCH